MDPATEGKSSTIMNIEGLLQGGYLHQSTFTYAFYQRNKSNVLEIFKFEK